MNIVKVIILVTLVIILIGCNSIEDYQQGNADTISQDDGSFAVNESLKEVKINIEKAHELGLADDVPEYTKQIEADKCIDAAMEALKQYLLAVDSIDIDFIDSISGLKVFEDSNYILIEYDKHYLAYGGGTAGDYTSWKVIKYKPYNLVEIFEKNSPLLRSHEHRMITINGIPRLFIYGYVAWDKGQTIFIKSYNIEETGLTEVQAIQCESNNDTLWLCYEDGRINTKEYMNKIFETISDDAKEVRILADDEHMLKLNLNEAGQYEECK